LESTKGCKRINQEPRTKEKETAIMIEGIPYLGTNHNWLYDKIIKSDITKDIEYETLYDLVNDLSFKRVLVIIDNKWLTWLHDIVFNYRDKECYIPYYEYELYKTPIDTYRADNKGHLILQL
jgi:hypothetical protein